MNTHWPIDFRHKPNANPESSTPPHAPPPPVDGLDIGIPTSFPHSPPTSPAILPSAGTGTGAHRASAGYSFTQAPGALPLRHGRSYAIPSAHLCQCQRECECAAAPHTDAAPRRPSTYPSGEDAATTAAGADRCPISPRSSSRSAVLAQFESVDGILQHHSPVTALPQEVTTAQQFGLAECHGRRYPKQQRPAGRKRPVYRRPRRAHRG